MRKVSVLIYVQDDCIGRFKERLVSLESQVKKQCSIGL